MRGQKEGVPALDGLEGKDKKNPKHFGAEERFQKSNRTGGDDTIRKKKDNKIKIQRNLFEMKRRTCGVLGGV